MRRSDDNRAFDEVYLLILCALFESNPYHPFCWWYSTTEPPAHMVECKKNFLSYTSQGYSKNGNVDQNTINIWRNKKSNMNIKNKNGYKNLRVKRIQVNNIGSINRKHKYQNPKGHFSVQTRQRLFGVCDSIWLGMESLIGSVSSTENHKQGVFWGKAGFHEVKVS